jgi:glyoxylase-like metal-dependent hydrolase (beta-lactamase superfamily II)
VGVEDFAHDSPILVSGASPAFIAPKNRPAHSLCDVLGIRCPEYRATLVPHMHAVAASGVQLGLTILHTPGHTPDELAVWDEGESMLYVGDTLYEQAPILFPTEGDIVEWWRSMGNLIRFVEGKGAKISAGHVTAGKNAEDVLKATLAFMGDVLKGKEQVKRREEKRGQPFVSYEQEGGRFSLGAPEKLVEDAKKEIRL